VQLSDKYPFLTNYFTQALTVSNRALPQSILFYGNDLDSQYILANEIARLLNCKEDKNDNCECLNCRWINEGTHPAVLTISRADNKPEDDDSKTVISIRQSQMIKEMLVSASEFHRVFIFCDRNDNGEICGLNPMNFQAETANSLLKIIEEPQAGVTFIFLTRYIDDVLPTIVSRSQCFFVPERIINNQYNYSNINGIFTDYFEFERKDVFDISQKLQELTKEIPTETILEEIQNYMLALLKSNPHNINIIEHIKIIEDAKYQAKLNLKPINIFDDICLKIIK
jgi:DNA polymerase III delta prime subunit